MRPKYVLILLFALMVVSVSLSACGAAAPKADVDINARILDIQPEERLIRVSDLGAGRHWVMHVRDDAEIVMGDKTLTFGELTKGLQIRVWANEVSGEIKYEVVKLSVTDSGEGTHQRR